jgi:hypothetical protein
MLWPAQYASPNAGGWIEPLRRGISRHISVRYSDIPQEIGNIVILNFRSGNSTIRVGIDYDDQSDLHLSAPKLDLYFKMQYRRGGYKYPHVVPGGYVSPKFALYKHVSSWRALRERRPARYDVFGRFGMRYGTQLREGILKRMCEQQRFSFEGGVARTTWWEYMQDVCAAKICLDAPGRGELCYRLVECLAVGSCIVGPMLENELHVPLEAGVHDVRVSRDLADLVETCERVLERSEARRELANEAAEFFDKYLRLEQLGGYYVDQCLRLIQAH